MKIDQRLKGENKTIEVLKETKENLFCNLRVPKAFPIMSQISGTERKDWHIKLQQIRKKIYIYDKSTTCNRIKSFMVSSEKKYFQTYHIRSLIPLIYKELIWINNKKTTPLKKKNG